MISDPGTLRPVRRSFYDPTSAPGQGWLWEWENDAGSWTAYDTEVGIAIQAAHERQQSWLDLAPLGFCYLIDFENMTQINGQTQRCRRIQRRSDLAYPLVSGPLPKSHHAWGPLSLPSQGGLLGVDVSGMGMGIRMSSGGTGNGSAYPSGALPASAITSLGQPCACQQCMLVLSVKAGAMSTAHTLGRRPPQVKPPSPKFSSHPLPGGSYSLTLPRPPSLTRSVSPHRTSIVGASGGFSVGGLGDPGGIVGGSGVGSTTLGYGGGFNHSLSLLGSATAALSISSTRPPPPPLPPPLPPPPPPSTALPSTSTSTPAPQPSTSSSFSTSSNAPTVPTPGPQLISTAASTCTPSPSARVLGPVSSSGAAACAAPLPPRSSLAGLSRPALQRIAMAQSRALIASG